jgi:hypothetical protein
MAFSEQVINTLLSLFTVRFSQNTQKRKQLLCSKEGQALKRQGREKRGILKARLMQETIFSSPHHMILTLEEL